MPMAPKTNRSTATRFRGERSSTKVAEDSCFDSRATPSASSADVKSIWLGAGPAAVGLMPSSASGSGSVAAAKNLRAASSPTCVQAPVAASTLWRPGFKEIVSPSPKEAATDVASGCPRPPPMPALPLLPSIVRPSGPSAVAAKACRKAGSIASKPSALASLCSPSRRQRKRRSMACTAQSAIADGSSDICAWWTPNCSSTSKTASRSTLELGEMPNAVSTWPVVYVGGASAKHLSTCSRASLRNLSTVCTNSSNLLNSP
mmetsp:Transcript_156025/g.500334  ORF Transcript_156025/g.500334 Transcript_156025/m.500334 type:complete len:260 (+) Transcript_156025:371-1150(+)